MNHQNIPLKELVQSLIDDQNFAHQLVLDLVDCRILVKTNSKQLLLSLQHYFKDFICHKSDHEIEILALESPDLELGLPYKIKQPDPGKNKIKEESVDIPGGRIVRKRLTGMTFLFGGEINLAVGRCLKNNNQVINFVNNRFIAKLLNQNALLGHSSAIKWGSSGLAMAGFSGMGKSTLALHLMSLGASYVSNDRLLVKPHKDGLRMFGVPKLPRINPGTALNNKNMKKILTQEEVVKFSALPNDKLWDLEYKYDVFIDQCFGKGKFELHGWVNHLVILNWKRNGTPFVSKEVNIAERIDLLHAFMKGPGLFYLPETQTNLSEKAYIEALSRVKVYEFSGGTDFVAAARACMDLLESHTS